MQSVVFFLHLYYPGKDHHRAGSHREGDHRKGNNRRGYYTLEAAIILPLVLLTVLTFAYFTRVEGIWENALHCAYDEAHLCQSKAWDGVSGRTLPLRIQQRMKGERIRPDHIAVTDFYYDFEEGGNDHLCSFTLSASVRLRLPAGFSRDFEMECPMVYRDFVGKNLTGDPLGISGLEDGQPGDPVWIFPAYGEKFHKESCRYVSASVHPAFLDSSLRNRYKSCQICHSETIPSGSLVFCFESEGSAYHRGNCRSIDRRFTVLDRSEAKEKGYTSCSVCGIP